MDESLPVEQVRGWRARPGFTVVELVIVLMVAGILGTVTVAQISTYTSRRAATDARDAFIAAAAQARAAAIRMGEDVEMRVDPVNDRVLVLRRRDGSTVIEPLDLNAGPLRGTILGREIIRACYTSRGFMLPSCGGTGNATVGQAVDFRSPQGSHTATAVFTLAGARRP